MTEDYYSVLKVSRDAPDEVIRASYNTLIRRVHPDVGEGDAELAGRLNAAKATLLDPVKRAEHDRRLAREAEPDPEEERHPQPDWGSEQGWDDPDPFAAPGPPPPSDHPPSDHPEPGWPPPSSPDASEPGLGEPWPAPPPYSSGNVRRGRIGAQPIPDGRLRMSARDVWWGTTPTDRVIAWVWLAVTLVGPVGTTIAFLTGSAGNLIANLIIYVVLTVASLHVARERILRERLPKRYVAWVLIAALLTYALGRESVWGALYFGSWLALFLAGTELRRRHLWART